MSDRTAAELEHDAELARARVADTAESIRAKMSPGQIIDEMAGLFTGADGTSALSTLKSQVSQNPLALSLVGAGMAWLMLGNSGASTSGKSGSNSHSDVPRDRHYSPGNGHYSDHKDVPLVDYAVSGDDGSSIAERISQTTDNISSTVGDALDAVKDVVSSASKRASSTAGTTSTRVADSARNAAASVQNIFSQEPLALAALGLALGAAIGVMLPHSKLEDQQLGDLSGKVRSKVKGAIDTGLDEAKDVAAGVYGSVKESAEETFNSDDGRTVADKVAGVLKTAASDAEDAIRDRVSTTE